MKQGDNKIYLAGIFLLLVLSIPLILPYFRHGYFPTHDGEWAVVRLVEMFRELKDLQIPPRWSGFLNFGYGYPLFNFAYPFPYYLGVIIHALGISFVTSIKLLFALSVPVSAIAMYFLSRSLWKNTFPGLLSAILYLYLPYRMVDLYVRGSIGESFAFALFPIIGYFIFKSLSDSRRYMYPLIGGIFFGLLVLSHNIMAIHFSILLLFLLVYLLVMKQYKKILPLGILFFVGIGISCYFWLPALFEKQYIALSKIPIADRDLYYVTLQQLLLPRWGYGPPTETNGFSYQLGTAHLLTFIFLIGSLILTYIKKSQTFFKEKNMFVISLTLCTVLLTLLLFPFSSAIWEYTPFLSEINYPWTLLLPIGFLLSIAAGFVTNVTKGAFVGIVLSLIAVFSVLPYAKPSEYVDRGDEFYMTNDATTTSSSEYMPLWVKTNPFMRPDSKIILPANEEVEILSQSSRKLEFTTDIISFGKATIQTIYYPGWEIKVNNNPVHVSYDNSGGLMEFQVPKGKADVRAEFHETPLRLTSDVISLLTLCGVLGILVYTIVLRRFLTTGNKAKKKS